MKKFRVFIDMEQEEKYLNEMAVQGWGLVNYSPWNIYRFEKIAPEIRNYRIDYQMFKKKTAYLDYLTLFEDSGWQHIAGSKGNGFHFFLPEANQQQNLDIFSDSTSKSKRYQRLYNQSVIFAALMFLYLYLFHPSLNSIASWYLTSSLWQYHGWQLFGIILMQTFFVMIQILPMMFFLAAAFYYLSVASKAKKLIQNYESDTL